MAKWISDKADDWKRYGRKMQKKYEANKRIFDEWCDHRCGECKKDWCDCPTDPDYVETNLEYTENGAVIVRH